VLADAAPVGEVLRLLEKPAALGVHGRDRQTDELTLDRLPVMNPIRILLATLGLMTATTSSGLKAKATTFGEDLAFLRKHTDVVLLQDKSGAAQIAVVPAYQGRVMTSTAGGARGSSFGWVNHELIASGKVQPHINVYGGEDRFWLGPEGGQFSIFFAPGEPFDLDHWFTPAVIDTQPFDVISKTTDRLVCRRQFHLTNYSGTQFSLEVTREVRLLGAGEVLQPLGLKLPPKVKAVGFESVNTVRNTGDAPWTKPAGLLSIWILGMMNASPTTTVVVPFEPGPESSLGPVANDSYFGKVPPDRLVITNGVLFFSADANYRSKIGIPPQRAKPMLGSYDAANRALTLVQFTLPKGATDYVNSMWQLQDQPFRGDTVNSYNDGPPKPGASQLGKFYELETSSPALALGPNETATHVHRTLHLQGPEEQLDPIARAALGVGLREINTALTK